MYETSSKSQAGSPIRAHTQFHPPPAHAPIPMLHRHSPPPQLATTSNMHKAPRLPRNAHDLYHTSKPYDSLPKIVLPHLKDHTKYCACHEKCQYHFRSFSEICTTPHVGVISTRSEHSPLILAETCHESTASKQHPETQIPLSQPHPTPEANHPPNANPYPTAKKTAKLTKCCTCAVNPSSILHPLTFPHV